MAELIAPPPRLTASTPLALAAAIAAWFPDLGGRAVAVADCVIDRQRIPQLPLCMVVFAGETAKPMLHSTTPAKITEKIVVEFWRKPERYRLGDGSESPFYAYVDYRRDRDALLHEIASWQTPDGSLLAYQGTTVASDEHAYTIEMHFLAEYRWCDPAPDPGTPLGPVSFRLGTRDPCTPAPPYAR